MKTPSFPPSFSFIHVMCAVIATVLLSFVFSCQKNNAIQDDFYFSGEDTIQITIPADSIGILMAEGADVAELRKVLDAEGYVPVREEQAQIWIAVSKATKRLKKSQLLQAAQLLREKHGHLIAQAGYLAYPKESKVPMVVTNEIILDFANGTTENEMARSISENGLEVVMQNPFNKTQYLVKVKDASRTDIFEVSRDLSKESKMKYAHPNFLLVKDWRRTFLNDPLLPNQWHLENIGQNGGTVDADVDSDLAWDFTLGNPNIVIAINDNGFDMNHPDLVPNWARNTGEIAGNGIDDDRNGLVDDIIGWDFDGCGTGGSVSCGDNQPDVVVSTPPSRRDPGNHGTSVAGVAAGRGNNRLGVSGSCPNCSILPIEDGGSAFADGLMFNYAQQRRVNIISNSWGYPVGIPIPANVSTAINTAAAAGITIFFAMNNVNNNDCIGATPDISSLPSVIAVSRSTNFDRFDNSGFGNCMDLLAPTRNENAGLGSLSITTTDIQGAGGYSPGFETCPRIGPVGNDYTSCFGGTSSATPLTAGVAGLLLSLDNTLTPRQVQNLLQDCADKIEHGVGQYSATTGFSTPSGGNATHGYGRVNAFEAARIAASVRAGGRSGVDIFLRDNALDWGNTEQPSYTLFESTRGYIPHFQSVDIKVDAAPFAAAPTTSAQFDAFTDERPLGGTNNKIYVRVHNRGYRNAADVTVKLHWVYAGLTFPNLPSDFWTSFPADASDVSVWHPLGAVNLGSVGYSGCSIAGTAADAAEIAVFDFMAPEHDDSTPNHYCLMALIDSPDDRLVTPAVRANLNMDNVTPFSNNATHRNITINNTRLGRNFSERFHITNPFNYPITIRINVLNPSKLSYKFEKDEFNQAVTLQPRETRLVAMEINAENLKDEAHLTVQQEMRMKSENGFLNKVMGGITFVFAPDKK